MIDKKQKMSCPDCGVEMNLHAEKVDYERTPDGEEAFAEWLGGAVEEFYTCPSCGRTHSRHAE